MATSENLMPEDTENTENDLPKHRALEKVKGVISFFQQLTSKEETDNMWVLGVKYFLRGVLVFLLILLSPFAIVIILISVMVTL